MDRFMDAADPARKAKSKAIQAELNSCRERIRLLIDGKVSFPLFSFAIVNTSNSDTGSQGFCSFRPLDRAHTKFFVGFTINNAWNRSRRP